MKMDPMSRPNVLFVICDQLRADHLGFAGNQVVRTPHIDAIAAGGTVFDRAYVNNPICMPNRSTMMTGRMPSAHGVIFNDRSLEPSETTFVSQLRDAGWRTGLIGKSHLQHGESRNAVVDLGQPAGRHSPFPDAWDTLEHDERYERGEVVAPDAGQTVRRMERQQEIQGGAAAPGLGDRSVLLSREGDAGAGKDRPPPLPVGGAGGHSRAPAPATRRT